MDNLKRRRGRPKISQDAPANTKAVLLRAGLTWLTTTGFNLSSLDNILRSVQVPKGSFYHHFDNKEDFGLQVLDQYRRYFENKLDRSLKNDSVAPLQRLKNFMADASTSMARYDYRRGCLIGNLEVEVATLPTAFHQAIIDTYHSWQNKVAGCLRLAQAQGEISPDKECQYLAEIFWIGWEGAVSRARLVSSDIPLHQFGQFFLQQLLR
ncbi:TetR/AcrR family transcriptional regulator [Arsukibacterium sp.]|uniref:acrylate utilization transcriptional regulator AcuR n=1 Tax=Arsukibacterium sp. TaxID=1977258 RepID=UPI00356A7F93